MGGIVTSIVLMVMAAALEGVSKSTGRSLGWPGRHCEGSGFMLDVVFCAN
jgi:hypothetical protein